MSTILYRNYIYSDILSIKIASLSGNIENVKKMRCKVRWFYHYRKWYIIWHLSCMQNHSGYKSKPVFNAVTKGVRSWCYIIVLDNLRIKRLRICQVRLHDDSKLYIMYILQYVRQISQKKVFAFV